MSARSPAPGSEFGAREEDLVRMPGFSKDIEASRAQAKALLASAGVPNLKVRLINRTVSNLYVPAGIYIIDQWRQIGVETEHVQANETLYNNSMNEGTFDVALDFQGDSVDEPTYQLARHLSVDLSSNRGRYTDREIDELFERQKDETDPKMRYLAVRAFETAHAGGGLHGAAAVVAAHRGDALEHQGLGHDAEPPDRAGSGNRVAEAVNRPLPSARGRRRRSIKEN